MDPDFEASLSSEKLEGKYANYFKVGHNAVEFVIDFGQFYSENKGAELYTRIITNPYYAKKLFETLQEAIEFYENQYGAIDKIEYVKLLEG